MLEHNNPIYGELSITGSRNSIINSILAFPFFATGFWLSKMKCLLDNFDKPVIEFLSFFICAFTVLLCGKYNGQVLMYINDYGGNIILFFIGGYSGTTMIYIVSKWLSRFKFRVIIDISKGTILILGFHMYFILYVVRKIFPKGSTFDPVYALLIVILFVPIIMFSEKHLPLLIGKYRISK